MEKRTTAYMIEISENARYTLDNLTIPKTRANAIAKYGHYSPTTIRRSSLRHYYHKRYIDNRPEWLVKARAWSVEERHFKTMVHLTNAQVADILKLSLDMDIDPKLVVNKDKQITSRGMVRYLLGSFLEAVLSNHLIEKEEEDVSK